MFCVDNKGHRGFRFLHDPQAIRRVAAGAGRSQVVEFSQPKTEVDKMFFIRRSRTATLTIAALVLGTSAVFAQIATTLEQAELAGLSPEKRAEVEARAVRGNTVYEVLQTMLLNNIKAKYPANEIVALDFNRGHAVVAMPDRTMKVVSFDTTTLTIKD